MNLKTKLTYLAVLLFSMSMYAQESFSLKGTVVSKSDNQPVPGVNVLNVKTSKGTTTNFDGIYEIKVTKGDVLQFSYVGFVMQIVIIEDQKTLDISLVDDASKLDEVVVIGYGTQKKSNLTGAISKVKNTDLDKIAVSRADDALVGKVAGVNIQAGEGEAGSDPIIQIRGVGSITGDSRPALVVDGVLVDADFFSTIDINNVDSFEVLKDAASASIYGSRGANGVIIITTKQGKAGKTKFTYNTYTGFKEAIQSDAYNITVADAEAAELAATGTLSSRALYRQLIGVDDPWQDRIFDGGIIQTHSLSARGGNEKTKFSVSLNYLHDEGVILNDDFKRYTATVKLDSKPTDRFSYGVNITPDYSNRVRFDGSTHDILRQQPWLPTYHDERTIQFVDRNAFPDVQVGDYTRERHFDNYDLYGDGSELVDLSSTSNVNPIAKIFERDRTEQRLKLRSVFYGQYKIAKGLNFRGTFSADYQSTKRRRYQGVLANRNGSSVAQLDISSENRIHTLTEGYFTYDKDFGKHSFNMVLGLSGEVWDTEFETTTGLGFENDLIQTFDAATTISEAQSFELKETFASYFGRVNYAYEDKYLASVSVRYDGSSVFGANNKFGFFPAVSVGWNLAREDFLAESDVISNFKFRASYGFTGNKDLRTGNAIEELFPSLQLFEPVTAIANNGVLNAFNASIIANKDLQWERSAEINLALDFGFFNNAITGSVDFYNRTSDQLLLDNPVSSVTGFTNALANIGEVVNRGVELEIRTRNISREKFKWNTTLLASRNENELTNFGDANGQIQSVDTARPAEWINQVGSPISSFYGYVVDTEIPLEFINNPFGLVGGQSQHVYVKDLNGDGIIDEDDKTILGDPYPDLIWSVQNDFQIGQFDLSVLFQGSYGAEVRNIADQYIFNHFNSSQAFNPTTTPNQGFIQEKIFTNDIIQDASYVALRTVSVGFSFNKNLLESLNLSSARIYATGQNLVYLTADNYTGFNPEAILTTSTTTFGYQRAGSPIQRTISLGINLEF